MNTCEALRHTGSLIVYEDPRGCPLCAIMRESKGTPPPQKPLERSYNPRLAVALADVHAGAGKKKPIRKYVARAMGKRVNARGKINRFDC